MPFGVEDFVDSPSQGGSFSEQDFVPATVASKPKRSRERIIAETQAAQAARPTEKLGFLDRVADAAYWPVRAASQQDLVQGMEEVVAGGLNKTLNLSARMQGLPQYTPENAPYVPGQPIVQIPAAHDPTVAPVDRAILKFIEGSTTPGNALLGPATAARGAVGQISRAQFIPPMVQGVGEATGVAMDSSRSPDERKEAVASAVLGAGATVGLGYSLKPKPEVPFYNRTTPDYAEYRQYEPQQPPRPTEPTRDQPRGIGYGITRSMEQARERRGEAGVIRPRGDEGKIPPEYFVPEGVELEPWTDPKSGKVYNMLPNRNAYEARPENAPGMPLPPGMKFGGGIGGGIQKGIAKGKKRRDEAGGISPTGDEGAGLGRYELPPEVQKVRDIEREKRGDFVLSGPRFLLNPKESGFGGTDKPIDAQHVWNRLANKLKQSAPDELKIYEDLGIDKEIVGEGKVTPQRVAEILAERGPRIETKVIKSGESKANPEVKEHAELTHTFYDRLSSDVRYGLESVIANERTFGSWANEFAEALDTGDITKAERYAELSAKLSRRGPESELPFDPDVYRKVAPKDQDQTVVMVRVPIKQEVPYKGHHPIDRPMHEGGHFGREDRNLLGWARGQWETTKDGKKVFHVIEVQSDWAAQIKKQKHAIEEGEILQDDNAVQRYRRTGDPTLQGSPLLDHYQRLVIKAVADHVKAQGGDSFSLSDSFTARLTEGHDQAVVEFRKSIEEANHSRTRPLSESVRRINQEYKSAGGEVRLQGGRIVEIKEPYEAGMELNYDQVLPKIAEEVTGNKGEMVDFGEHQMAWEARGNGHRYVDTKEPVRDETARLPENRYRATEPIPTPRQNLIFRNPDESLKTSATARLYSLDKIPSQASSLFEKDRPATREQKLYGAIPGSFLFDPDFHKGLQPRVRQAIDLASSKTVPTTMRANVDAANALVRFAISQSMKDKQVLIDTLLKKGLAKLAGSKVTAIQGQPVASQVFTLKGRKPTVLLVRKDIAPELRHAVDGPDQMVKGLLGEVTDVITKAQVELGVDAVWHTGNILAAVNSAQRKNLGRSVDLFGTREMDTIARIGKNFFRKVATDPLLKKEIAQFTRVGAGRGELIRPGFLDRETWSGKFLKKFDQAGRVTLNQLYNELVDAKLTTATEHGRREFVNAAGQYNTRLMSRFQHTLREIGLSPFVVAGRNFNKLALQKLMLSPGVSGTNKAALAKMMGYNFAALTTALVVTPIAANMMISGTPFGRKGVPPGAIDTGKDGPDGEPIYFDLAHLYLVRRGLRITGATAVQHGIEKGDKPMDIVKAAGRDIIQGAVHPYAGPPVRSGFEFAKGMAETPQRIGEHLVDFGKDVNPTISAVIRGQEEGDTAKRLVKTFAGPFGAKIGPKPTFEDKRNKLSQETYKKPFAELTYYQKFTLQDKMNEKQEVRSDKQKEKSSIYQVHREFDRLKEIKDGLSGHSRDFVTQHKLNIPNIETSIRKAGVQMPLDKDQAKELVALTTKFYEEGIQALTKKSEFAKGNDKLKAQMFKVYMHVAKNKAREKLKLPPLEH